MTSTTTKPRRRGVLHPEETGVEELDRLGADLAKQNSRIRELSQELRRLRSRPARRAAEDRDASAVAGAIRHKKKPEPGVEVAEHAAKVAELDRELAGRRQLREELNAEYLEQFDAAGPELVHLAADRLAAARARVAEVAEEVAGALAELEDALAHSGWVDRGPGRRRARVPLVSSHDRRPEQIVAELAELGVEPGPVSQNLNSRGGSAADRVGPEEDTDPPAA